MKAYQRIVISVSGLVFLLSIAAAQTNPNLETGFKPFGSYDEGTFDTVNLATGNLTISYPLLTYPQRGSQHEASERIYYNGKAWGAFPVCNLQTGDCTYSWQLGYRSSNFPAYGGQIALVLVYGQNYGTWTIYKGPLGNVYVYTAYTEDGSVHQLAPASGGGLESIDATGIYYGGYPTYQPLTSTVIDKRGVKLGMDTNGNENYWNADTLGRNLYPSYGGAADLTGCPSSATSVSLNNYPGPNGGTVSVKTCYGPIALKTNFNAFTTDPNGNVRRIAEASVAASLVVGIVVYNGTSWATSPAWSFQYDSRDSGDPPSVNYGDLTKITLPTGGTISYTWGRRATHRMRRTSRIS